MNTNSQSTSQTTPRIVSLLPGATEWVCELGLEDCLVGVSHECDYPGSVSNLPKVTRSRINPSASSQEIDQAVRDHSESRTPLFDLDQALLQRLQPNLILTQTLCNVCAVSESDVRRSLQDIDSCQLIDLKAMTFDEIIEDAELLIAATKSRPCSTESLHRLKSRIQRVRSDTQGPKVKTTLLEWASPLYCAGHWTPQLIQWAGGIDPIGKAGEPSREIEADELIAANPDVLLLACCGLDRDRNRDEAAQLAKTPGWSQLNCVKNDAVHIFDGSAWFNRPGPRLIDALEAVHKILQA